MRLRRAFGGLLTAGALTVIAGCSDEARQRIGLDSGPPDEFAVVTRAPLALPPGYALRPPAPGTRRPQEAEIRDAVRETLIRSTALTAAPTGEASRAESALLQRAGAGRTDPGIRSAVDAESAALAEPPTGLVDRILFWRKPETPGEVVDPGKEAQRLQSNAALGKPPAAGPTPIIERRERGFLEGLFN